MFQYIWNICYKKLTFIVCKLHGDAFFPFNYLVLKYYLFKFQYVYQYFIHQNLKYQYYKYQHVKQIKISILYVTLY